MNYASRQQKMKNLYIHLGIGKTGSSYLQTAFACNVELYRRNGLIYPDLSRDIDVAQSGMTTSGNGVCLAAAAIPLVAKSIKPCTIPDFCQNLDENFDYLVSSEWLCQCPLDFLLNLQMEASKKHNCTFIAYVRNPADHIASWYLQGLKDGVFKDSIDAYIDTLIAQEKAALKLLIGISGCLKLVNYDFHRANVLATFDSIVFGRSLSIPPNRKEINPSPTYHQSEILLLASRLGISNLGLAINYLEESVQVQNTHKRFLLPDSSQQAVFSELSDEIDFINNFLPDNEEIRYKENMDETGSLNEKIFFEEDAEFLEKLLTAHKNTELKRGLDFIQRVLSKSGTKDIDGIPADFDPLGYLLRNPDVVLAEVDPWQHYLKFGRMEGRF